jgi:hypothetical protein
MKYRITMLHESKHKNDRQQYLHEKHKENMTERKHDRITSKDKIMTLNRKIFL